MDMNFDNVIFVDNLPVVPQEKYEKLVNVLTKIFGQIGQFQEGEQPARPILRVLSGPAAEIFEAARVQLRRTAVMAAPCAVGAAARLPGVRRTLCCPASARRLAYVPALPVVPTILRYRVKAPHRSLRLACLRLCDERNCRRVLDAGR